MSEMIGNYFFLTHSYARAVPVLEAILQREPENPRARKKLVIAYIETGRLRDGFRLYERIMTHNPQIILNTDPEAEDCPCPQLVDDIARGLRHFDDPANRFIVMGIYSSYCNAPSARAHFESYLQLIPEDRQVPRILQALR